MALPDRFREDDPMVNATERIIILKISTVPKMLGAVAGSALIVIAALFCLGALSMQQLPRLERIKHA